MLGCIGYQKKKKNCKAGTTMLEHTGTTRPSPQPPTRGPTCPGTESRERFTEAGWAEVVGTEMCATLEAVITQATAERGQCNLVMILRFVPAGENEENP